MPHKHPVILRAAEIDRGETPMVQRLNPRSKFASTWLSGAAGFQRVGVSRARLRPGDESFAYHAHLAQEEWIYIVSGRARARIDDVTYELAAGDFVAYPAPQPPHLLSNPYTEDCVYLMGGERMAAPDVIDYPDLGKRYVLLREPGRTAFHELGAAEYPFGRADRANDQPPWRVIGTKGCGSVIAEAALTLCEIPFEHDEVDYSQPSPGRDRLLAHNPLGQVPTVVMPDGAVMTETAAIALHLDELVPGAGLFPPAHDPLRRDALRWLVFLVAAIYPTFTYGDDPAKWVGEAGPALRESSNAHREKLWRQVESVAKGPWFLGPRFSMLDVYICVMTRWRPRRDWFAEHCPKLAAIANALDDEPRLRALWAANF